ncbi:hypothetical protein BDA99DRAFT_562661 [Phascolomyces articulosus]|uniref:Uncharacterized protein n=1 Tax=Phascolomyces articulosus TaxID=60185 RepID=A0AAD5JU78_9FUNG|nr:hypothetical protein BDA99DRAFT_562661 [Phascolomyces articulosus]
MFWSLRLDGRFTVKCSKDQENYLVSGGGGENDREACHGQLKLHFASLQVHSYWLGISIDATKLIEGAIMATAVVEYWINVSDRRSSHVSIDNIISDGINHSSSIVSPPEGKIMLPDPPSSGSSSTLPTPRANSSPTPYADAARRSTTSSNADNILTYENPNKKNNKNNKNIKNIKNLPRNASIILESNPDYDFILNRDPAMIAIARS